MRTALFLAILGLLFLGVVGSIFYLNEGEKQSVDIIEEKGVVRFIDLEGGFYGIVSDGDQSYYPINLDPEFQEDGLRVWFEAKIRKDIATIHMWGTPIEIIKIEKI